MITTLRALFLALALLLIAPLGAFAASRDPITVTQYGADPTGATDSSAAFRTALTAVASATSKTLLVPPGTYVWNDGAVVTMPANVTLEGVGMPTIQPYFNHSLTLGDFDTVRGIKFDTQSTGVIAIKEVYFPVGGIDHCLIEDCRFYGGSSTSGIYAEVGTSDNIVRHCFFNSGGIGVNINGIARWVIEGCQFNQTVRPIEIYGSSGSVIANNSIIGGTTGILFLSSRAGAGTANVCIGNSILGNTVSSVSDEGISMDCFGNDPTNWPENGTLPIATYASSGAPSSTAIQLNISETGMASGWANNYYAVPLTGNNIGHPFFISSSNSGYIIVQRSNGDGAAWTVGDKFQITLPFFANTIKGNTCVGCGLSGITFWGSAWHNLVEGNTCVFNKGIGIQMSSAVQTLGSTGAWFKQCWSGFNIIRNNTIQNIENNGDVAGFCTPIELYTSITGSPPAVIYTPGYQIIGNVIASSRSCYFHDINRTLIEGNVLFGGSSFDLTNTTDTIYGRNYIGGKTDLTAAAAVRAGTTTRFISLIGASQADLAGNPLMADFNTLLANLRAAQLISP